MLSIILFTLASLAGAAIYLNDPCPKLKPVDNFNLTAYTLSPWYEIAKYPNDAEDKGDCSVNSYTNEDGVSTFHFIEIVQNRLKTYDGFIDYDPNTQLLNHRSFDLQAPEKTKIFDMYVLALDYNSYSILYDCKYNKLKNQRHGDCYVSYVNL